MWDESKMLLHSEGTRARSEDGQTTSRPRSEGGQEMSQPVQPTAWNRGATLPVTARPPKHPETHIHEYEYWCARIVSCRHYVLGCPFGPSFIHLGRYF